MPTYFTDRGVISCCEECGCEFKDTVNKNRIFDDLPCLGCAALARLLEETGCPEPSEPTTDAERASLMREVAYAF